MKLTTGAPFRTAAVASLAVTAAFAFCSSAARTGGRGDGRKVCSVSKSYGPRAASTLGFVVDGSIRPRLVERAIERWQACGSYGRGFPFLQVGAEGATQTILVRFEILAPDGQKKRCGKYKGDEIVVYRLALGSRNQVRGCGSLVDNLAHEMGHALGLMDAPDVSDCLWHVMAEIHSANFYDRPVTEDACEAVDAWWVTPFETPTRADRPRPSASAPPPGR